MQALLMDVLSLICKGHRVIALDIPLLAAFPNFRKLLAAMVVVVAPPGVQLQRLMARNNFSEEEARTRIAKQASADEQKQLATHGCIVDNSGTLEDLDRQMELLLKRLPSGWSIYEDCLFGGVVAAACAGIGVACFGKGTAMAANL